MALPFYHTLFPCLWVFVDRSFRNLCERVRSIRELAYRDFGICLWVIHIIDAISNMADLQ